MKAHEIYQKASPATITAMFQWFRDQDRELYKSALATLATDRKLRPAFVQKKPVTEQISWMHKTLQLKTSDNIGEHLFQGYLMRAHTGLLKTFCDGMGIEHDGDGSVEGDLPETLDAEKLNATVDELLKDNDADLVKVYLHVFAIQTPKGWDTLNALLKSDKRVAF